MEGYCGMVRFGIEEAKTTQKGDNKVRNTVNKVFSGFAQLRWACPENRWGHFYPHFGDTPCNQVTGGSLPGRIVSGLLGGVPEHERSGKETYPCKACPRGQPVLLGKLLPASMGSTACNQKLRGFKGC